MTVKQNIPGNTLKSSEPQKKRFSFFRFFRNIADGSIFDEKITLGLIPYILFLGILAMIYISNIYKIEDNQWKINKLEKEVEDLKLEHVTTMTRILSNSQRSSVSDKVKGLGLILPTEPPYQMPAPKP